MISKEKTVELATKFGNGPKDTGAAEVQVAILTTRIQNLSEHFGKHIHDYHGKTGLMKMIGSRRRFLRYLAKNKPESYNNLIAELGLRK